MKLTVLQEELSQALSTAIRFVSSRAQLPILANIVLSAKKTKLLIYATNLEVSVALSVGAKVDKDGDIAVPARMVSDLVANLKKGPVDFELRGEILKISTQDFEGSVAGVSASEFPLIPKVISKKGIDLPRKLLDQALNQVAFSVSLDETRPILTGILFLFKDKKVELVSSDGFRLSRKIIKLENGVDTRKMVIPKSSIVEVAKIPDGGDLVGLEVREEDNQVVFGGASYVAASRVLEGEFPNFEKIIPKETTTKALVDKEELLRAVKLASVYAREAANVIKLEVGKGGIAILAESQKTGSQKTHVEAQVEGEKVEISFNFRFLEEFLNCIKGEEVEIGLNDASSPGVFRDTKEADYLHLIMPVRLQG